MRFGENDDVMPDAPSASPYLHPTDRTTNEAAEGSSLSMEKSMHILQIEHPVSDYDGWKKAFDSDPAGREASGVRGYRIARPLEDPHYVRIDLELDTAEEAEALLAKLRPVWARFEGTVMSNPQTRIIEVVEMKEY